MKLSVKIISIVICALFVIGSIIPAIADTEGLYAFVKTNRIALYSTSVMKSRSRYLYKYDLLTVLANDGTKAKVKYGNKTGFVFSKYIAEVSSINETAYINRDTNIYLRPSTSATKQSINKNTKVNILMYSGTWAMIEKDGILAYIQKLYLSSEIQQGGSANQGLGSKTDYSLKGTVVECDFTAKVNASSLNVYSRASASSSKLGTIKRNTIVNVYAYNSTWAYIELNGRYGYCKWAYLKKVQSEAKPSPTTTVNPDETMQSVEPFSADTNRKILVYDLPSESGKYLGYVSSATTVKVLAYNATWAQIELNGKKGYTLRSGLTYAAETPTPSPTPSPTPTPVPTETPVYASTDEIFLNASTTNEQKIYEYLTSRTQYNEAVACGILANIKAESNFNPTSGKGKSYQGLCQWSTTRFAILTQWCENNGYNPYSLEGQIKFLWYDLSERYTVYHKALMGIENTSEGAYQAGYYFCYYYERPSSLESSSVKRGTNAKDVYWVKYAH